MSVLAIIAKYAYENIYKELSLLSVSIFLYDCIALNSR